MSALLLKRSAVALRPSSKAVTRPTPTGFVARRAEVAKPRHVARAESEGPSFDSEKFLKEAQQKFDAIENKPQVALYTVGAIFALYLTSQLIGAINHVPLIPKLFELVGLGYSAWFTYRYLLFKSSRQELLQDIEAIKAKLGSDK